ncbi:MAG TPA: hypothetical protein VKA64_11135 [Gammaproteobacteria bacterium]|nr:hypothetical protein [Gammaproteobacteria bacterium]
MANPAELQILGEAERRLGNISQANGYYTTAANIARARVRPWQSGDIPAANIWTGETAWESAGTGFRRRTLALYVDYRAKTRDRPFIDVAYELAFDVDVALRRAPTAPKVADPISPRLGELVEGFEWLSKTPAIGQGNAPVCGAILEYQVVFSHPIDDPTTLLGA